KTASARWSRSCRRARSSGSSVVCGPAASSAMVSAPTATSKGSCDASSASRSMITDVSATPRGGRGRSATRGGILISHGVEVGPAALIVDAWCGPEYGDRGLGGDEAMAPERGELADGNAIAGDDEGLPLVELAHDLSAVV